MEYGRKFQYGMEYGMEDFRYGMEMEWKKIASMEYGKIVFHSIPYHALVWFDQLEIWALDRPLQRRTRYCLTNWRRTRANLRV